MGLSVKNTNYVIIVLTCDLGMFLFLKNVKNWNFLNWYLYVFKQKEHFSPNPLLVGNQGGKKVTKVIVISNQKTSFEKRFRQIFLCQFQVSTTMQVVLFLTCRLRKIIWFNYINVCFILFNSIYLSIKTTC